MQLIVLPGLHFDYKIAAGCLEISDFKHPVEFSYLTIGEYRKDGCLKISDIFVIQAFVFDCR